MNINIFDRLNELKVKYAVIKSYACILGGEISDEHEPTYSIICHKRDLQIVRTLRFTLTDDYADVIVHDFTKTNHQDFNAIFNSFTMVMRNEYGAVYEPKGVQSFAEYYKTIDKEDARTLITKPRKDKHEPIATQKQDEYALNCSAITRKYINGATLSAIATEYATNPARVQTCINKYCSNENLSFDAIANVNKINKLLNRGYLMSRIAIYMGMSTKECKKLINKYN